VVLEYDTDYSSYISDAKTGKLGAFLLESLSIGLLKSIALLLVGKVEHLKNGEFVLQYCNAFGGPSTTKKK